MATDTTAADDRPTNRLASAAAVPAENRSLGWGSVLLVLTGALFVLQGLATIYRGLVATTFEPGVHHLDGLTAAELAETSPEVASYVDHLAVNLGGAFLAIGVAIAALAWFAVRRGRRWALATVAVLPLAYAGVGLSVHQGVHFHYDQLAHLGPAGLGLPLFLVGAALAWRGLGGDDAA